MRTSEISQVFDNGAEDESVSDFLDSLSGTSEHEVPDDCEGRDEQPERHSSMSLDTGFERGAARKDQWKSQSLGESLQQSLHSNALQFDSTSSHDHHHNNQFRNHHHHHHPQLHHGEEDDSQEEKTTFSANRELWQRRATSQTHLIPTATPQTTTAKSFRSSQEFREMRQKHTPDLVMDLPLSAQDVINNKSASSNSLSSSDEETVLPLTASSRSIDVNKSPTTIVGPESPDMSTAAERFAKQNQCTLKKNTKTCSESGANTKLKRLETELLDTAGETDAVEPQIVRSTSNNEISPTSNDCQSLRSPLPARSTPKIAAKFADMRLTGGSQSTTQQQQQSSSFKPQVKVKPTILRKPNPCFPKSLPHGHMSPELARKIEKQQVHNNTE